MNDYDFISTKLDHRMIYLACFRGRGVVSKTIKFTESLFFAYSEFTHVGLLIHSSQLNKEIKDNGCIIDQEQWIVFESTLSGRWNDNVKNTCSKTFFGVQMRKFSELIKSYNGREGYLAIGKLLINKYPYNLNQNLKKYLNIGYDYNIFNLLSINTVDRKLIDTVLKIFCLKPTEKRFCSDFVFKVLNECGLIPDEYKKIRSKNISPSFLTTKLIFKDYVYITKPH